MIMVSSTIRLSPRINANSVMTFKVYPNTYITPSVVAITVTIEMTVISDARSATQPTWAASLVRAITGRVTPHELTDAVRLLLGPQPHAIGAAVSIAAVRIQSLKLYSELWKLIAAARSSQLERLFAFQLYWRLESLGALPFATGTSAHT